MNLKEELEIIKNEIEKCVLSHQEFPNEECDLCNCIDCELSKREDIKLA